MGKVLAKMAVAALAGVGLAAAVATTPAEAASWHGGGWGGGWHGGGWGGGWHGGGWGGAGWGGGGWGWRGAGWRGGGWGWGGGWGNPYWGGGWGGGWGYPWWGWGPPVVVAGAYPYYAQPGDGCWVTRRVWSQPGGRGRYLGRHLVNICQ